MLIIRPVEVNDAPVINKIRNVYAKQFLHNSKTFTLEETTEWVKTLNKNNTYWMIEFNKDTIGYFRITVNERRVYIGADISPQYTGRGLAKESYKMFIPVVLREYATNTLYLEVLSTNTRAKHLYDTLGFVEIERYPFEKNGTLIESIVMKYENRN